MPIAFNLKLSDDKVAATHLLKFYLDFLRILNERGPVKATAQRNLPAKLVMELFEQGYDYLHAPFPFRARSVRKEADAWFLSDLYDLGRVSGLIIKRKGRIGLTKKGQKALTLSATENYFSFLRDYVFAFNMGYEEGWEPLPPFLIPYVIDMLSEYGSKERAKERFDCAIFRTILEQFLAEFWLVEPRRVHIKGHRRDEQFVRTTKLFNEVFITW